jgi:L-rhamnose mutarotase
MTPRQSQLLVSLLLLMTALVSTACTEQRVQRVAWVTGLKPEKADYYRQLHANPWPGVNRMIKACHIQNFSIYEREIDGRIYLFAYLEYTGDDFATDMARMAADPETQRWWKECTPCQLPLAEAASAGKTWADAREIYHLP